MLICLRSCLRCLSSISLEGLFLVILYRMAVFMIRGAAWPLAAALSYAMIAPWCCTHSLKLKPCAVVQPCGGAIPLCMVDEFDIPAEIIDRKVTKMKMISPSNREVDVGKTLSETEYIGMCRREVLAPGTVAARKSLHV